LEKANKIQNQEALWKGLRGHKCHDQEETAGVIQYEEILVKERRRKN